MRASGSFRQSDAALLKLTTYTFGCIQASGFAKCLNRCNVAGRRCTSGESRLAFMWTGPAAAICASASFLRRNASRTGWQSARYCWKRSASASLNLPALSFPSKAGRLHSLCQLAVTAARAAKLLRLLLDPLIGIDQIETVAPPRFGQERN